MTQAARIGFAAAAARLSEAQANPRERRRFRRVPLAVRGRMLDSLGREHDCRTADISPGDVRIFSPVAPTVGERVVIYLEGLGRISGAVARRSDGEAAIIFDFSAHKRERMAEQLTLAMNAELGIEAARKPIDDTQRFARVQLETGETYQGEVLDFSLTGVTIQTTRPPPLIGEWVRIGATYGRVARYIENGFAVGFDTPTRTPSQQA